MKRINFRILLTSILLFTVTVVMAQPAAVKKASSAVVSITTFRADGSILSTSGGVFIDEKGTIAALWTPFVGADHAVAIDSKGVRHDIDAIIGVNEIYDIATLRISSKSPSYVPVPSTTSTVSEVWAVTNKKGDSPKRMKVSNRETFMDKYTYYILDGDKSDMYKGLPVIDDKGTLLGLYSISSTVCSVTDIRLISDFVANAFAQNMPAVRQCGIRVALPNEPDQARIALMLAREHGGKNYEAAIEEYISRFPTSSDGYYDKAYKALSEGRKADSYAVMETAIKKVVPQDAAHYDYARILIEAEDYDKALVEVNEANKIAPQPLYNQMEAQIDYLKGNYQSAYDKFMSLTNSSLRNGELFYQAMQAKAQLGGTNEELLSLLDSAVAVCDTPYTVITAPYFYARANVHENMKQYRKAVADYYQYEALMYGRLSAEFYFQREQCEAAGKMFQPALFDIARATALDPKNAMYWAEWASLSLRVNRYEEAIKAAEQCILLNPEASEPYLILGIAQAESGKKQEGLANIGKAKSMGNTQADSFLSKYK